MVPPPLVSLGAAAPNGIIAGTAVTCITGGIINADVSVSPGNTVTGFGPCVVWSAVGTATRRTCLGLVGRVQLLSPAVAESHDVGIGSGLLYD